MAPVARALYADRVAPEAMDRFVADFSSFRLTRCWGAWKPYKDVVGNALQRTCKRKRRRLSRLDVDTVYAAVPLGGRHPDVTEPLARVAKRSRSSPHQFDDRPHPAFDREARRALPCRHHGRGDRRLQAADEGLRINAGQAQARGRREVMHCSSSFRYDLMTAHDMHFGARVLVNRGHEPTASGYATHEIADLGGLPALLGR